MSCPAKQTHLLLLQVLEADVPAASSTTVKAWRSEQHAHDSETEALLSFMQHHAVNLGVSCLPQFTTAAVHQQPTCSRRHDGVAHQVAAGVQSGSRAELAL
jgi:hypothetical protein